MVNKKEITKDEFEEILLKSNSKSDIYKELNFPNNSVGFNELNKLMEKFNLNTKHFDRSKWYPRKYLKVEKECSVCGNKFISIDGSKKHQRKFCSISCGNKFRVGIRYKIKNCHNQEDEIIYKCLYCNSKIIPSRKNRNNKKKFCNCKCCGDYNRKETFKKIEEGIYKCNSNGTQKNRRLKLYLIEKHGYKCTNCGNTEWMGKQIPLQLDHINGDSKNDNIENIRNLCPNCHAQTETYGGKNRGRGRKYRMDLYYKEKERDVTGSIPVMSTGV